MSMEQKDMNLKEFRESIKKNRRRGKFDITNSWGVRDVYNYIRKNKWYDIGRPLKNAEFYAIIRKTNNLLAKELLSGRPVNFPFCMGKLELRKNGTGAEMKDGKLKIHYPIDWDATTRLWFEDEEARRNKTLVRIDVKEVFRIHYDKYKAKYNNKGFYEFAVNRFLKRGLKESINNGKIDALW